MIQFTRRTALMLPLLAALPVPALADDGKTAHDFSFTAIEGTKLPMSGFRGKAVLLVNTASRCGFTGQYDGLQALYERYRDRGLVVLGVPSNAFRQELSSSEKVKTFCEVNFGIDFPMTEITQIKGPNAHPLFAWLAERGAEPSWNFNKFLIGPDGSLRAHFGSVTGPQSGKLVAAVEDALPSAGQM